MAQIIDGFSDTYIGIVCGYDINTRELDVFIPKLMPAIPENRENVSVKTNLGMVSSLYNIKYNPQIILTSTIKVRAEDMSAELPKVGSRVEVYFLEGNPLYPCWSCWNYNGDYEIIDEEKYPKYFSLKIGGMVVDVNKDDVIEINVPEKYEVLQAKDDDQKHKVFNLVENDTIEERLNSITTSIGNIEYTRTYTDTFGVTHKETVEASGLYKLINELQKEITFLKNKVSDLTAQSDSE